MNKETVTERFSSGTVAFPLSKDTEPMMLNIAVDMFRKNGYTAEIEYRKNDALIKIGIKEGR